MLNPFDKTKEATDLDEAIDESIAEYRSTMPGDTDEAGKIASNIRVLTEIKANLENKKDSDPRIIVAVITALSSLSGILMITRFEQLNVLASKALPFIKKL